jgi:hypothetical protein
MATLTIKADATFDGEYNFDLAERAFNGTELHLLKEIAGVLPADFEEAITKGDNDLVIALAVIALRRANRITKLQIREVTDVLMEAPVPCITIADDEAEVDARPPVSEPETPGNASGSTEPSGLTSNGSSDHQEPIPSPIGRPG